MAIPPILRGPHRGVIRDRREAETAVPFSVGPIGPEACGISGSPEAVGGNAAVGAAGLLTLQGNVSSAAARDPQGAVLAEMTIDRLQRLQVALLEGRLMTAEELEALSTAAAALRQAGADTSELGQALTTRVRVELAKRAMAGAGIVSRDLV